MKGAFLHKNFRLLPFERKIVFLSHLATCFLCFAPWVYIDPVSLDPYFYNGFSGETFFIGWLLLIMSLSVCTLFVNHLFDKKEIRLPIPESHFYIVTSALGVLLALIAGTVLWKVTSNYEGGELRFGIISIFVIQVMALTATILFIRNQKVVSAQNFFQHPPR